MFERRSVAPWPLRLKVVFLSVAVAVLVTCDEPPLPTELAPPTFLIADAAHSGDNPDFFFLPPMVADPSGHENFDAGRFDAGQSPVVEICETECAMSQPPGFPLTFDVTTGPGSETVRLNETDEHYIVNWHTNDFPLDEAMNYRIRVLVAGTPLGFADVNVYPNMGQARNANTGQRGPDARWATGDVVEGRAGGRGAPSGSGGAG